MPRWNSKLGVWEPAQEYAVNPDAKPGENPVYQGPDRAALAILKEQGVESLGMTYSVDPELVIRSRQLGFKSVDEYLQVYGFDKDKALKVFEAQKAKIALHDNPEPKPAIKPDTGGRDYSGQGKDRAGAVGELPADVPAAFTR